jgi:hypothetical protein
MKRMICTMLGMALMVGVLGCSDTASTTKETKVETPTGESTTTTTTEVEKSGEAPPPAQP